jgi:hypothetical protein
MDATDIDSPPSDKPPLTWETASVAVKVIVAVMMVVVCTNGNVVTR